MGDQPPTQWALRSTRVVVVRSTRISRSKCWSDLLQAEQIKTSKFDDWMESFGGGSVFSEGKPEAGMSRNSSMFSTTTIFFLVGRRPHTLC